MVKTKTAVREYPPTPYSQFDVGDDKKDYSKWHPPRHHTYVVYYNAPMWYNTMISDRALECEEQIWGCLVLKLEQLWGKKEYGLYADRDIEVNEIICPWFGYWYPNDMNSDPKKRDKNIIRRRGSLNYSKYGIGTDYDKYELFSTVFCLAGYCNSPRKLHGRGFMKDKDGTVVPNAAAHIRSTILSKQKHLLPTKMDELSCFLYAIRPIKRGEQIYYDYGEQYNETPEEKKADEALYESLSIAKPKDEFFQLNAISEMSQNFQNHVQIVTRPTYTYNTPESERPPLSYQCDYVGDLARQYALQVKEYAYYSNTVEKPNPDLEGLNWKPVVAYLQNLNQHKRGVYWEYLLQPLATRKMPAFHVSVFEGNALKQNEEEKKQETTESESEPNQVAQLAKKKVRVAKRKATTKVTKPTKKSKATNDSSTDTDDFHSGLVPQKQPRKPIYTPAQPIIPAPTSILPTASITRKVVTSVVTPVAPTSVPIVQTPAPITIIGGNNTINNNTSMVPFIQNDEPIIQNNDEEPDVDMPVTVREALNEEHFNEYKKLIMNYKLILPKAVVQPSLLATMQNPFAPVETVQAEQPVRVVVPLHAMQNTHTIKTGNTLLDDIQKYNYFGKSAPRQIQFNITSFSQDPARKQQEELFLATYADYIYKNKKTVKTPQIALDAAYPIYVDAAQKKHCAMILTPDEAQHFLINRVPNPQPFGFEPTFTQIKESSYFKPAKYGLDPNKQYNKN